ncbi:MAG: hypothetical protein ACI857_000193 [Arenicella sp.]|jgi:hypothetical protein
MKRILLLSLILISALIKAQEPAHFFIGKEVLAGIDIYDLLQDKNEDYWLATDNGLFKYDGYKFVNIEFKNKLSSSFFSLSEDHEGGIYCNNLSGQIFKVSNDVGSLYYQIPDSLMSSVIVTNVDNLNRLVVNSKRVFYLDENKIPVILRGISGKAQVGGLFALPDSSLLFLNEYGTDLYYLKNNKVSVHSKGWKNCTPRFFIQEGNLIAYDYVTGNKVYQNGEILFQAPGEKNQTRRIYCDNSNVWDASLMGGSFVFDKNGEELFNGNRVFNGSNVSAVYRDKEGNILIGTLGSGLIVIPNIHTETYRMNRLNDKPTCLAKGVGGGIYLGSQMGKIYELSGSGEITELLDYGEKRVEKISFFEAKSAIVFDGTNTHIFDPFKKNLTLLANGSLKDVAYGGNGKYFMATNVGINISALDDGLEVYPTLHSYYGRVYCVGIDSINDLIYAGKPKGLKIGDLNSAEYFELNREPLLCTDINYYDGLMYACTYDEGILIFKDGKLQNQWNEDSGLPTNTVYQIRETYEGFAISTNKGVYLLSINGEISKTIGKAEGLFSTIAVKIEVVGDILYVLDDDGLQRMDLSKISKNNFVPEVSLSRILVDDQLFNEKGALKLNYDQNKVLFELECRSLKYASEIEYTYQLIGVDEDKQRNDYYDNLIEYKSVPPGKYTFEYSAICRGIQSETETFDFEIWNPFWKTTWFLILSAIFIVGLTLLIVVSVNRTKKRKAKLKYELRSSQLATLKSQMNPHFIFNSLNSIQDLILQQSKESAYNYITKFAILVRKILNQSGADFIEISEEIEVLEVYLQLEKLRFKKDLTYEIIAEKFEDIEIPPMLVQPFVENALKHGLLHKKGDKKLRVEFKMTAENLVCVVSDNGIGRKRSAEIKFRQRKGNASFSTEATNSRFELLQEVYGGELGLQIEDLNEDGETGTKVTIKIPIKRRFDGA